jgi:hypothetical protein
LLYRLVVAHNYNPQLNMNALNNEVPAWFLALTPQAAAEAVRTAQKQVAQKKNQEEIERVDQIISQNRQQAILFDNSGILSREVGVSAVKPFEKQDDRDHLVASPRLAPEVQEEHQTPSNKEQEAVVSGAHQVVELVSVPAAAQQPAAAVVVNEKKRKTPDWECPICTEGLYAAGMVPCAIRGCQHMICKKCGDDLMKSTRTCPCCRNHMLHLIPLLDLIDKDDRAAMTLLTGLKGDRLTDPELLRRIDALDICQDNAIKERLTFVARGALEKVYAFNGRKSRCVSWAYVPDFDVKRITLKVEDARKIMGVVNPNREKLRYALHQKALLIENGLNEVFAPDFNFTATEQTNEKGTFQHYMCFKITKKL